MIVSRTLYRAAALAGALASAGCVTMPSERAEAPPLPTAWRDAPQGAEQPVTDWWRSFNDPALNQLVDEALADGPSVQLAVSRVREARALSYSTITQFLPQLQATGSGQYSRIVEGAVGMVQMALEQLKAQDVVELDEERKAQMVSNLLVVLCGNSDASPVINTGTLYG